MIQILFATQTGNSEFYAEEVGRHLEKAIVSSIEDFDFLTLPEQKRVIFIVSTTGDGDMTTDILKFWQFLLIKDLPKESLIKLEFTVFGLGDSSYPKFNYAARKLRSRLLQLSAKEFVPSAFGDEQHPCGIDTEFVIWFENLVKKCETQTSIQQYIKIEQTDTYGQQKGVQQSDFEFTNKKRLSAEQHDKETYQYNFKCNKLYECGDILCVKPRNQDKLVSQFLAILNLDGNKWVKLEEQKQNQKSKKIPKIISIQQLFSEFLDITSPPNRYFIKLMSQYAERDIHKQKLTEMCAQTPEGLEEYYSYVYREKRNVYEVLYDFQPCFIPLEFLIDSLKLIRERQYSISSAYDGEQISLTVALVSYTTGKNRPIKGFCSNYLDNLVHGQQIEGKIIKGTIAFPKQLEIPIIMVGPGTGVAPFIGFIEQRVKQGAKNKEKTILFFGSCYENKEFYYKEFLQESAITLFTAFSRDQQKKIYVQHRILENRDLINKIVRENAQNVMIIVTGTSKKMPTQVEQVFKECLGEQMLQELKRRKQYLVECW
ncbi:unnamed protein product (macronuclear) [Paramecium tetraurelia]|uniref:Flavodoxin-like domain-containing protein n=1 Tax=Paramecium tetraurelia TaxID=5888 RepID=A0EE80_PARTE|nr:uncharacterized protein GSPATT00025941001 [Paramecium tetraurelia]CAK93597.1 unnamed protein product [Paramecium tetraurelia]|eukprot:XP_001460994.1 hypothetical protein (macronuclear) [Paramecium tetraurelia strain d4-2]